ncbi:hypothetical protein BWI17_08415 [Betaproteobacteria bacterium GR16-43]|nr:hypothetical protein BWI17_08415 [Betaproteobacteria bacterium GR16-43]
MSLVEVMIVVLVAAILIAAAIPSFTIWIQNTQIRTASESVLNGLQTARNEAIRRNSCVQIKMMDSPLTSWEVRECKNGDSTDPATLISGRSYAEGSQNATSELLPIDSSIVSFNALGRVVLPTNPSDGSPPLTQVDLRNTTLQVEDERRLRIEIPVGGAIRLCDPKKTVAATDPRRCVTPLT